jgi:hypothetical protein
MPPAGFEPATPESQWPQTHALNGAATWIGGITINNGKIIINDMVKYRLLTEPVETAALRSLTVPNGAPVHPCKFQTARRREFALV